MMVMFWVCIKIILFRGIVLFLTKLTSLDNFSLCSVDIFTWSKILPMLSVQIYLVYHFVFVVNLKYFLLWPVLESYQIMHVTILDNSFVELFCLVHLQMMPPHVFRLYIVVLVEVCRNVTLFLWSPIYRNSSIRIHLFTCIYLRTPCCHLLSLYMFYAKNEKNVLHSCIILNSVSHFHEYDLII